jgi:hypothetical protein
LRGELRRVAATLVLEIVGVVEYVDERQEPATLSVGTVNDVAAATEEAALAAMMAGCEAQDWRLLAEECDFYL